MRLVTKLHRMLLARNSELCEHARSFTHFRVAGFHQKILACLQCNVPPVAKLLHSDFCCLGNTVLACIINTKNKLNTSSCTAGGLEMLW